MTRIRETILTASPPSEALRGLERYLATHQNVIQLMVPLKALGLPIEFGMSQSVRVSFRSRSGRRFSSGRTHDSMSIEWSPEGGGPFPTFEGVLTLRPNSSRTEIDLRGQYTPPLGEIGAVFDAAIGKKIARATIVVLLEQIKQALEAQFATFKEALEPTH